MTEISTPAEQQYCACVVLSALDMQTYLQSCAGMNKYLSYILVDYYWSRDFKVFTSLYYMYHFAHPPFFYPNLIFLSENVKSPWKSCLDIPNHLITTRKGSLQPKKLLSMRGTRYISMETGSLWNARGEQGPSTNGEPSSKTSPIFTFWRNPATS